MHLAVIKSPNFAARGRASPVRVLSQNTMIPQFLPLPQDVPDLILENRVRVQAILSPGV